VRWGFARSVFAVVASLSLAACAANGSLGSAAEAGSSGDWQIASKVDAISGKTYSTAVLETNRVSNAALPFAGGALLQLVCFKGEPLVHLTFAFQLGANATSTIAYRFDDKPGRGVKPHFLRGNNIFVIEEKDEVRGFVNELAAANVLIMRVSSLTKGQTTAEFRVTGAAAAVSAAFARCPL
jgi:hypothetical protein